jgi:hypothetical protein
MNLFKEKIIKTLNFFSFRIQTNQFITPEKSNNRKILVIGHGEVEVPPLGWGAVETVIYETTQVLTRLGFSVAILNSKSIFTWMQAYKYRPSIVILHDDSRINRVVRFWPNAKKILITHYGYAAFPKKWEEHYRKNLKNNFKKMNHIICLSPAIYSVFAKYFTKEKLIFSPNGSAISQSNHLSKSSRKVSINQKRILICLGKVEERKKQYELYQITKDSNIDIHFFGPIVDKRVIDLIAIDKNASLSFKGSIARSDLQNKFQNYQALIHFSHAEADALVLYEAQLMGLPIIISEYSVGAQNLELPWIKILPEDFTASELNSILESINTSPQVIFSHAQQNYLWEKRMSGLIDCLSKI